MSTELFDELFEIAEKYNIDLTNSPDMHPGVPEIGDFCGDVEKAVLAAGYRKPRQVTTVEELDALPSGSVILDCNGEPNIFHDNGWVLPGGDGGYTSWAVAQSLPAMVLHVGGVE